MSTERTLRDEFAGLAMQSLIKQSQAAYDAQQYDGIKSRMELAEEAYRMADAMLAARGDGAR